MAGTEKHMEDCQKLLDNPFEKVHRFLDQYAGYFPTGICQDYHRTFLHNEYGYKLVRQTWGEKAGCAVLIHLVRDLDFIFLPEGGIGAGLEKWLRNGKRAMILFQANIENMGPNPIFTNGINVTIAQKKVCQLDEKRKKEN